MGGRSPWLFAYSIAPGNVSGSYNVVTSSKFQVVDDSWKWENYAYCYHSGASDAHVSATAFPGAVPVFIDTPIHDDFNYWYFQGRISGTSGPSIYSMDYDRYLFEGWRPNDRWATTASRPVGNIYVSLDLAHAWVMGSGTDSEYHSGTASMKLSSIPYDLTGTGVVDEANQPPNTTHQFSGSDKNSVTITLTAIDEWPGVDKTVYIIDGSLHTNGESLITQFSIDLDEVNTIKYYSVDKNGMAEETHSITINKHQDKKAFKNEALARDTCFGLGSYYSVYFTIDYFRISDELSDVLFVDEIDVSDTPNNSGIIGVALRLDRNGEELGSDSGSLWYDIGAVDWQNRKNNYQAHAQLRSTSPPGCERFLSKSSLPLIISPGGIITVDNYSSDRIFSTEIPVKRSMCRRIWDIISPLESESHEVEIEQDTVEAVFNISWPGSDLDLILHDPNGREINPSIATTDPNINFLEGNTYEQYTIAYPITGNWTMQINAVDIPLQGEEYITTIDLLVNQQPVAVAGGPYEGYEGSPITFNSSASYDADGEIVLYEWDFNDDGVFDSSSISPITTFTYGDNYIGNATLRVTDDEGLTSTDEASVTVINVAPTVISITAPMDPVPVDTLINISGDFTDPGILDTHTAEWDWGDNATSPGTVNEINGSGNVTGSHTYTEAGVYTISLNVTDDDGGWDTSVFEYIVVYDPSAGFVTGGGWIDSPEGAYMPEPSLTGKATFGFVSKYKKGAKIPTGETEFQFKVADLNFHSDSYQWLVIAGPNAKYKGWGTINGEGEYGFMLTATDEKLTPSTDVDMFRIKIWDINTGVIIYDNKIGESDDSYDCQEIGGGSIVIHKK